MKIRQKREIRHFIIAQIKNVNFFMWEDTKHYNDPIKVTKAKLKSLLSGKKAAFKFVSKKDGKEYEMYLKLKINGTYVNFEKDGFVNKKKK